MKKAAIITILLLILSVGGTIFAFNMVNSGKEQVTLTEKTIYGDISAAEGLTVSTTYDFRNVLFWDVKHTLGKDYGTEADFSLDMIHDDESTSINPYFELDSTVDTSFDDDTEDNPSTHFVTGLTTAFKDFENEISKGNTGKHTIKLKDYYDYYPISGSVHIMHTATDWSESYYADIKNNPDIYVSDHNEEALQLYEFFNQYFKIPVLDNDKVVLHIEKNPDEDYSDMEMYYSWENQNYDMETVSAITDDACYFTITTYATDGSIIDTSQIEDGYGIYKLPITEDKLGYYNLSASDFKNIENAFPLDPAELVFNITIDEDKNHLLMQSSKNGNYYITVIDLETMTELQKIDAGAIPSSFDPAATIQALWSEIDVHEGRLYIGDDFIATVFNGSHIVVLTEKDGRYEIGATIPLKESDLYFSFIESMDYENGKLAICCNIRVDNEYYGDSEQPNFDIAVFDHKKLLYAGQYGDTLSLPPGSTYEKLFDYDQLMLDSDIPEVKWS